MLKGTVFFSMQYMIFVALVGAVAAGSLSQNYGGSGGGGGGFVSSGISKGGGSYGGQTGPAPISHRPINRPIATPSCGPGLFRGHNGQCVRPRVSQNVYVFDAPKRAFTPGRRPRIPPPKIQKNVVFIRTSQFLQGNQPIVVPPTQQQTVVYVLSKNQAAGQQVIEIPDAPALAPEVYYIHYNEGQNPSLPGGISLQDALSSAQVQTGQAIGGGGGGIIAGGGGGGGYSGGTQSFGGSVGGIISGGGGGGGYSGATQSFGGSTGGFVASSGGSTQY